MPKVLKIFSQKVLSKIHPIQRRNHQGYGSPLPFYFAQQIFALHKRNLVTSIMHWFATHFPHLVSMVLSLWQAAHLRDRVYRLEDDWEILYTALEDIRRINRSSKNPNPLIESVSTRALNKP